MKKFTVEKIGSLGERIATWELGSHAPISSPGLWLTTSICGVPNLTPETIEMCGVVNHQKFSGILISYEKQSRSIDIFENYQKGFLSFCGLPSLPTLLTVMDPMLKMRPGFNTAKHISVWGECNQREKVDLEHYIRGVKAIDPDAFVSLCDSELSSNKRTEKALKFNHDNLSSLLTTFKDNKAVISALEGGYDKNVREKEAKYLGNLPCNGFLFDGFHENGETALEMKAERVKEILQENTIPHLRSDQPRFFFGMCDPKCILQMIKLGVDYFETSYVYYMTEKGHALTFPNSIGDERQKVSEDLPKEETSKPKICHAFSIDLNDEVYKNDFSPLVQGCTCYACRKHTRGYVNHLLATRELLGTVLLTIHNLHHYSEFFQGIRDAIHNDQLQTLENAIFSKI